MMMPMGQGQEQDPFKMYKRFRKFLKAEETTDKSKEKKKEGNPTAELYQKILFGILTLPITGPLYIALVLVCIKLARLSAQ